MSLKSLKTIIAAGLLAGLAACQPTSKLQKNDIVHITATDQTDASNLADAGEQLVSPQTFMLADRIFDTVLAKDPINQKALFYKAFLKRFMALKGVYTRIRPLWVKYGGVKDFDHNLTQIATSPLKTFLTDGNPEAPTEETILKILTDYRNGADEFRRFVKKNPDFNMTVNLNPYVWSSRIDQNIQDSCQTQEKNGGWEISCDIVNSQQAKMNVADIMALGQEAAGEVLWLTLYTGYNMQGVAQVAHNQDQGMNMTPKDVIAFLSSQKDFGKLRADHSFALLPELGSDFSAAVKWMLKYQAQVCPQGADTTLNRPGYVFNTGFCYSAYDQQNMAVLDAVLAGVTRMNLARMDGTSVDTRIDAMAIARHPIQDLRTLTPTTYDACGQPTSILDNTLGGIFVDHNADQFVLQQDPCQQQVGSR